MKTIIVEIFRNGRWICLGCWRVKKTTQTIEQIASEICPRERIVESARLDDFGVGLIRLV